VAGNPHGAVEVAADISIDISNRQRKVSVDKRQLETVARAVLVAEGRKAAELSVVVVDDRRIATVHGEWLDDPTPTDVITFDLGMSGDPTLRGDIVVSAETAAREARRLARGRQDWTPHLELAYYLIHGILHLTGFDDRATDDRRRMRVRERAVMKAAGLPPPPRRAARRRP
jgi:probable rRNA maturation factor